jgi:hypothetical protein
MRHPTDGTLRRLLDEPAGVSDAEREHVAECPVCLSALAAAQQDAVFTSAALGVDLNPDVDAGWRRLTQATTGNGHAPVATPARASRWRRAVRSPVLAAFGVAVLVTGASAAAAADWLQIFRAQKTVAVSVTEADLVQMPDLSAYGELQVTDEVNVSQVADAAEAEARTGLSAPQVGELPKGVTGVPTFQVADQGSVVFTFSADQAAKAAKTAGEALPPPPDGLDGSRFRLVAGPGLAEVWSESRGVPALVVARAVAPTAFSSGVPFATARDYLLSLPGLPKDLVRQLRSFSGDGTTLPLPVPAEYVTTSTADVGGNEATVLESRDGSMAGVVWVEDGVVTAVAGSLSTDEVLSVARGLK